MLLHVDVQNKLMNGDVSAEADAVENLLPYSLHAAAGENAGAAAVEDVFSRLCVAVYDLPLFHGNGGLSLVDNDDGTVADDILIALGVGASFADALFAAIGKNSLRNAVAVIHFQPLIRHDAAGCAGECLYYSHFASLLLTFFYVIFIIMYYWRSVNRSYFFLS